MEPETMDGASKSTLSQNALRKAAILISTLETRAADALLAKMPAETADLVRQTILEMDDVSSEEQNEVIREFMSAGGQPGPSANDGVELDLSVNHRLELPKESEYHREPTPAPIRKQPFAFLRDATSETVARHLERQHPQVIALVAAHLPPGQAADVIKRLSPKLQADVLRRVAELDVADEEVLRDVEAELETLLSDELRIARNRQTGLATVQTILNAAGADRGELLKSLTHHEEDLAAQLRRGRSDAAAQDHRYATRHAESHLEPSTVPMTKAISSAGLANVRNGMNTTARRDGLAVESTDFDLANAKKAEETPREMPFHKTEFATDASGSEIEFDDLTILGDDGWAVLIRTIEPQVVLLALTGASEPLLKRITQRLPKNEAQALRSRLNHSGPLRLSDIEQAQRHVARLAGQLAARGEIELPARRAFAAAA